MARALKKQLGHFTLGKVTKKLRIRIRITVRYFGSGIDKCTSTVHSEKKIFCLSICLLLHKYFSSVIVVTMVAKHPATMQTPFLFFLVLLLVLSVIVEANEDSVSEVLPTGSVISIRRSVDTSIITNQSLPLCNFTGGTITFAGPSSLEQGDKYYFHSYRQRIGYQLILDYVNRNRCGMIIDGKNYKIDLQLFDDQSSMDLTEAIAIKLVHSPISNISALRSNDNNSNNNDNAVDLIVAGYSSALTKPLSTVVAEYNQEVAAASSSTAQPRLMLSAGSSLTSNFADRPNVYTVVPPVAKFLRPAIEGLGTKTSARTIATIWEDVGFTYAACAAAPDLAAEFGMELVVRIRRNMFRKRSYILKCHAVQMYMLTQYLLFFFFFFLFFFSLKLK